MHILKHNDQIFFLFPLRDTLKRGSTGVVKLKDAVHLGWSSFFFYLRRAIVCFGYINFPTLSARISWLIPLMFARFIMLDFGGRSTQCSVVRPTFFFMYWWYKVTLRHWLVLVVKVLIQLLDWNASWKYTDLHHTLRIVLFLIEFPQNGKNYTAETSLWSWKCYFKRPCKWHQNFHFRIQMRS